MAHPIRIRRLTEQKGQKLQRIVRRGSTSTVRFRSAMMLFAIQTATTRPTTLGRPFSRWSIRKLAGHLRRNVARPIRIGCEALRCLLARRGVTFQRTKTWNESTDPDFDASWTGSSTR